jgi:hypothetical protein
MTLLEKAQLATMYKRVAHPVTDEEIEVAIAWLEGKVATKQVSVAYGEKTTTANVLYRVATVIREAYRRGIIGTTKP